MFPPKSLGAQNLGLCLLLSAQAAITKIPETGLLNYQKSIIVVLESASSGSVC